MNFKWILIIALTFNTLANPVYPQAITFNSTIIFKDTIHDESACQVLEVDSGYILCGASDYTRDRMIIARLDKFGQFMWKKTYGTLSVKYRPGFYDSMIRTGDGDFAIILSFIDTLTTPRSRLMLMKFNINSDTLWSKMIYIPGDTSNACYAYGLIQTNDKGFLVFGEEEYMGVMVKTDSLGNKEWLKYYGPNAYADCRYIFSACQTTDSGYVVGGHRVNIGNAISGNPFVICYDKFGNIKWEKGFGGEFKDRSGTFIQPVNDSIFMVTTNITTSTSGPPYYQPVATDIQRIQIKDNGDVIYNSLSGINSLMPEVHDLKVLHDGTFIATGNTWDSKSWIMNFSLDDDKSFFRMLEIPSSNDDYICQLRDVLSCSDDGIFACGGYNELYNGTNHWRPWLIKTDRFGCVEMGCDSTALYVINQPIPAITCKNIRTCLGIVAQSVQGNTGYIWQTFQDGAWQNIEDEMVYQGFDEDTLLINSSLITNQQESYRCNFYNDYWSFYSDSVVVNFLDTINIVLQPQSQSTHYGEPASISIDVNGFRPIYYQWFHDDQLIEGKYDSVLLIQTVTEIDTGAYFCRMTNDCGESESEHVYLKIDNLGIDEDMELLNISIHPNPAKGMVNIWVREEVLPGNIRLLDLSGRPISVVVNHSGNSVYKLDLAAISPGIYFLVIQSDNKEELVRKIIKN